MTDLTFSAIDVETANSDPSSICQIGLVVVRNGIIEESISLLVNPEAAFNDFNVELHGIDEAVIKSSETLPSVEPLLRGALEGKVTVSHSAFDRNALRGALARYELAPIQASWLDSSLVARQAWPDRFRTKWNLAHVADYLGIVFQHHDAAEDARAAAEIVIRACHQTGRSIPEWVKLTIA